MLYFCKYMFLKSRLFGYFNSIKESYTTLLLHPKFMEDVWIQSDYLNFMLIVYDEKPKSLFF